MNQGPQQVDWGGCWCGGRCRVLCFHILSTFCP